jgi:hypothetical protein
LKKLQQIRFEVLDFVVKNPQTPYREIAMKFGVQVAWLKDECSKAGVHRPRGNGSPSGKRQLIGIHERKRARLLRELAESDQKIAALKQMLEQRDAAPAKENEAAA